MNPLCVAIVQLTMVDSRSLPLFNFDSHHHHHALLARVVVRGWNSSLTLPPPLHAYQGGCRVKGSFGVCI